MADFYFNDLSLVETLGGHLHFTDAEIDCSQWGSLFTFK